MTQHATPDPARTTGDLFEIIRITPSMRLLKRLLDGRRIR
jgi:hypothetical protein